MIFFELEENSGGRGLPARLPQDERILWQGAPSWRVLLRRMFRARLLAAYFALLIGWHASESLLRGVAPLAVGRSALFYAALSLVPLAFAALFCWAVQKTTVYTITTRRVVMSYGVALSMSINLPYAKILSAGMKLYGDGTGDIPLQLMPGAEVAYFMVWPHARPRRFRRAEPMLRALPDARAVAAILGQALAAHAAPKPVPLRQPHLMAAE